MSKLKSDVDRVIRNKIEQVADILDNPALAPATKVLQLVHDLGIERTTANKLVNSGKRTDPKVLITS